MKLIVVAVAMLTFAISSSARAGIVCEPVISQEFVECPNNQFQTFAQATNPCECGVEVNIKPASGGLSIISLKGKEGPKREMISTCSARKEVFKWSFEFTCERQKGASKSGEVSVARSKPFPPPSASSEIGDKLVRAKEKNPTTVAGQIQKNKNAAENIAREDGDAEVLHSSFLRCRQNQDEAGQSCHADVSNDLGVRLRETCLSAASARAALCIAKLSGDPREIRMAEEGIEQVRDARAQLAQDISDGKFSARQEDDDTEERPNQYYVPGLETRPGRSQHATPRQQQQAPRGQNPPPRQTYVAPAPAAPAAQPSYTPRCYTSRTELKYGYKQQCF